MNIVLDTNILLVSISPKSQYYVIFESFLKERYNLIVTTEILLEYEEILNNHLGDELGSIILQIIENAPNTIFINRYFQWNLIEEDNDDNKFVDASIAGEVEFIVTHDRHFEILNSIPFPKVRTLGAKEFIAQKLNIKSN